MYDLIQWLHVNTYKTPAITALCSTISKVRKLYIQDQYLYNNGSNKDIYNNHLMYVIIKEKIARIVKKITKYIKSDKFRQNFIKDYDAITINNINSNKILGIYT